MKKWKLHNKLKVLTKQNFKKEKKKEEFQLGMKQKVVYINSAKKLPEKHINLLSLVLNFGVIMTPKMFTLVKYIQACNRIFVPETGGRDDDESVEKQGKT